MGRASELQIWLPVILGTGKSGRRREEGTKEEQTQPMALKTVDHD